VLNRAGKQLGNYRLIHLLGGGSFAEVYLGEHIYFKNQFAVKVLYSRLTKEDLEGFFSEIRSVSRLIHPHIVKVLDFGVEIDTPFLVMDYASNGTLRQRHPVGTLVPPATVVNYVIQIGDALQYAHDLKMIHQDIKPENMLLGQNNEVLLSDFGIASTLFQLTHNMAGTFTYIAPEQINARSLPASDQYALGIVVYEWLSGAPPFYGSFYETTNQHLHVPPPSLREKIPTIPPQVEQVVLTALEKEPQKRFASVRAFAEALTQACASNSSYLSISTYAPPSPISSGDLPTLAIANQPAQVQEQSPVAYTPPMSSGAPIFIDKPAQIQQLVTPIPAASQPFVAPTLIDRSAEAQQSLPPEAQLIHTPSLPTRIASVRVQLQQSWKKPGRNLLLLVLVIFIIAGTLTAYFVLLKKPSPVPLLGNDVGVSKAPDGEYIGISDGTFAFDTNRPDGLLKSEAADKLKAHNISAAKSLWQSALQQESKDAEALIYLENQRVLTSGHAYITLVVGTVLTGSAVGAGREDLQGAYVAQKEFNDGLKLPGGVQIRLLIANSGNLAEYATTVAQQLVQAAQADKTIVGVMGWPFGGSAEKAIAVLAAAHIPMVSPTAYDDFLTGTSLYFFRVVPPGHRQAIIGAQFAEHRFHARKVALFVDPDNTYSKNLAANFEQQFVADGNTVVATEKYTVGQAEMLPGFLQDALRANPDLIYFAGYADDVKTLLAYLPTSGPFANIQVLGGEALYEDYHSGTHGGLQRLHFTASAYSDEWDVLNLSAKKPLFFTEYQQDFNPNKQGVIYIHPNTAAMLSYDATLALLIGSSTALAGGKKNISPSDLQQGLTKISGSHAIQGVSGQVSFGSDGDPVNKVVVLLYLDSNGNVRMESVEGTLLVGT
jgi:serine/threonine protein kinase/ABC-type branched-subunit amino acid transport system substrate-binding protein